MSNEEQERTMKFEVSDEQLARLRAKLNDMNRDTQFAGFAKLLLDDLIETRAFDNLDARTILNKYRPEDRVELERLLARRAYDFVCHVIEAYEPHLSTDDMVRAIPDMPQWPEETTP